ncbi:MAG: redoxin domain-containing protein [Cyclobacteriaceae bacterium]|nr:redoxin domain-containing protein [Cyclobacteriaceae bacterium]
MHKISVLGLTLLLFLTQCTSKKTSDANAGGPPLPSMKMLTVDGKVLSTDDLSGPLIVVVFSPDCDHCQREATQIHEHLREFRNYEVYFGSSYDLPVISEFQSRYELNQPNFHFGRIDPQYIVSSYGYIDLPSLYIYNEDKRLIKAFVGETPIEQILKYL